ncbi:MAG: SDR family NAD(P)-dependent oxidoreductase, partial [Clostridiaceae bacterium]
MDLFDLSGHKAIVTGGTRGLGHSMAEGLMEAGAEAVIFGSSPRVLTVAQDFCARGFLCHGVQADLRDRGQIRPAFEKALALLGGDLQILVNCAGIIRRSPCSECSAEDWED